MMTSRQKNGIDKLAGMMDARKGRRVRRHRDLPGVTEARKDFFAFCRLRAPDFYRPERTYQVQLCRELQDFYHNDDQVLVMAMPPRHGKSRTAGQFAQWAFGQNPAEKVITGSYNEKLSTTFAKNVRNGIQETKASPDKIVYSDIFPDIKIQRGDASASLWSLEGQYASYLATSPTGTATGFGCTLMIIDDIIKNAYEANNADILDAQWDWFTNTMLSRLEEGGKIIIIMTRWATKDLAGRAIEYFTAEGKKIRMISMKAVQDDGSMLCPEILSRESYEMKTRAMGADIAAANYQQEPIDVKGRLYSGFKTYDRQPGDFSGIYSYTDTADEGRDWLCSIIWGVYNHEAYVLDVYYTQEPMEVTEPETARRLKERNVTTARIESNSGGRGFARAVRRELEDRLHWYGTVVKWFTQTKNKVARILTGAPWIMEHAYYPVNWRDRWPEYFKAMNTYQREGKNAHDDAPDATTGMAETMQRMGD